VIQVHYSLYIDVQELRAFSHGTHLDMPSNWDKDLHGHIEQCPRALLSIDVHELRALLQALTTILQGGHSFGTYPVILPDLYKDPDGDVHFSL
jgi:hypothetical protein